ncbi:MAG: sporulation membrane protein YtaF [Clostridiales bacterium]|nr:sporulation membrane protein YtaF [Clostridiales bacterium]
MLTVLLFSFILSIDALGIGISYGLRKITLPLAAKMIIALMTLVITSTSLVFGKILIEFFPAIICTFLGALLLLLMGIYFIVQSFRPEIQEPQPTKKETVHMLLIRSLGITVKIIHTPITCDQNHSKIIEPVEALFLGAALSLDSFGTGIGISAMGLFSPFIPVFTSIFQLIFLVLGIKSGEKLLFIRYISEQFWTRLSGTILIFIAFCRLFHCF